MNGFAGLVLASVLLLVGCYTGASADHFVAVVDELSLPLDWKVAQTIVRGPGEAETCDPLFSNECPAAIRTYLTDGEMDTAYVQAKQLVTGAGFAVTDEATAGCSSGSSTGLSCAFFADRGDDDLSVRVYSSPDDAGLEGDLPRVVTVVFHASSSS